MKIVEPIRNKADVKALGEVLQNYNDKYFVLWRFGVTSGLRVSDILALKVKDVRDKKTVRLIEKKTGKNKSFPINPRTKILLDEYIAKYDLNDDDYLIYSNKKLNGESRAVTRQQAHRVLSWAAKQIGIESFGTHSMRKTFGYFHYKQYNNIVMLQKIFNHSDPSITLAYIGILQETIDDSYMGLDI